MDLDLENFHDKSELRNFSNDFGLSHLSDLTLKNFQLRLDLDIFQVGTLKVFN